MTLTRLEVQDFRCVTQAQLDFDPRCTLISGANGAGKTSLLEAIHYLSCGHSFRSNHLESLIRQDAPCLRLVGQVQAKERSAVIGVESSRSRTEIHFSGRRVSGFAEIATHLPVQVIDPEVHRLLEDGPKHRRRFVDWGVFHVEPRFVDAWRRYQRALKQRNAALKAKASREIVTSWDGELVESGSFVAQSREKYIAEIQVPVGETTRSLLGFSAALKHRPGWSEDLDLAAALASSWSRDTRYGVTTVGPHRADVVVEIEAMAARERVSRGQQKLLAAALMLAQLSHRAEQGGEPACLLLDDPAAELDVDNLEKLLVQVAKTPAQLIVTALDVGRLAGHLAGQKFHVKQGQVTQVV